MMFQAVSAVAKRPKADMIIVPFFQGKKGPELAVSISDLKDPINLIIQAGDFSGKAGSTMLAYLKGKKEKRMLLLGMGKESDITVESLRRSYSACIKRCKNKKWPHVNLILPKTQKLIDSDIYQGIVESIGLSSYLFEELKSKANQEAFYIKRISLVGAKDVKEAKKIESLMSGVNLARDLIIGNATDITPQALGNCAKELGKRYTNVKATVLDKKRLEKEKMGLLLAVGRSSEFDPALIQLEYTGNPTSKDVTLVVGKGITYDTGGLNLKPTGAIEDMRCDMGGGAAAIGIIKAAAALKLKANIVSIIPSTENAMGPTSYKPGDVYRSYCGKTVEITNTDAEGRLALADALSYGQKHFSPSRIIDLATLTGAVMVALGSERAGFYSNDDKLAKSCETSGEKTGDLVWRLPLDADYKKYLKSTIADIKNCCTKRLAGSVTAAMFLQEFIEKKTPWIHLDIAGTAFLDSPRHYHLTQATGSGVRLVIDMIQSF